MRLKGLDNLTLSNDFRILAVRFFQMNPKRAKGDPIQWRKKCFFPKKIQKVPPAAGAACDTIKFINLFSTPLKLDSFEIKKFLVWFKFPLNKILVVRRPLTESKKYLNTVT